LGGVSGKSNFKIIKEKCMKNTIKLFGIIAMVAIIAFAMAFASCGDGGGEPQDSQDPPEVAHYESIELTSSSWENEGGSGENYGSGARIKLSDFTNVKPKQGDVLQFKISGASNKELKNFKIELFHVTGDDWGTYAWLGNSSPAVELSSPFVDYLTNEFIIEEAPSNRTIYVALTNVLWQKNSDGEYIVGDARSERFPPNTPDGTVMATISNFSISLVVADDDHGGGTEDKPAGQALHLIVMYFDYDGPVFPDQYHNVGQTVTIVGPIVPMEGYTFTGWNTDPYGEGTSYSVGDTFIVPEDRSSITSEIYDDGARAVLRLYAIWTPEE
jgi:uncharacterized repeat protein (TIGR02543 family)